ncbi:MAG: cation:proton antiporter [Alphaproteobacteria bacterium]|nr:cation:proton antiporter [Alphaproteobacteria bacterium]
MATAEAGEYRDVVLFLATAGVAVPLFRQWRVNPILGFLGAGVVLGPYGLGALKQRVPWLGYLTIQHPDEIAQLAELGVVFLLFMIGLELSWERLRSMGRLIFGLGFLQVAVCAGAIGAVAVALGQPLQAAAVLGMALALSSTAIIMPLLAEQRRQNTESGRAIFSVLLLQDLAVAPMLVTLTFMARPESETFSPGQLLAFAPAVAALVGLVFFGRLVVRPLMRSVARTHSEELFIAAALLVVIGSGLIANIAGLSMGLGAFIAGLLLAETEYRMEVEAKIEPFKGLLLGLFFVSVGIGLDLSLLAVQPLLVLGLTLGLLVLNGLLLWGLARLFGFRPIQALEIGLLLAASGEFSFVLLQKASGEELVAPAVAHAVMVSSTLSMFCIPLLAALALALHRRAEKLIEPAVVAHEGGRAPRVIVVGYGRVGRLVAEMMTQHAIPWLAIDRSTRLVEVARREGSEVLFGDASRPELLRRIGLETALALVVTMDSPEGNEAVVATAREVRRDLVIVARARDAEHAKRLYALGASDAVPETIEASLQLSEALLIGVGLPVGPIIAAIHERRDQFRRELNDPNALGGRSRQMREM